MTSVHFPRCVLLYPPSPSPSPFFNVCTGGFSLRPRRRKVVNIRTGHRDVLRSKCHFPDKCRVGFLSLHVYIVEGSFIFGESSGIDFEGARNGVHELNGINAQKLTMKELEFWLNGHGHVSSHNFRVCAYTWQVRLF